MMITDLLPEIKQNKPLAKYTTFKIGGPAKFFYQAQNSDELLAAVKAAEASNIPFFILGWGSNLLVSDQGFDGLVIKSSSDNLKVDNDIITCDAGVNLSRLIGFASQNGLSGLEFAVGIPGTVGGAVFGNAGAYGNSFGNVVKEITVYRDGEVIIMPAKDLGFAYRESVLKSSPGLILTVTVKLEKKDSETVKSKILEIIKTRKSKVPPEPSAGCVFKNIDLGSVEYDKEKIKKGLDISEDEWFEATKNGKLAVGYILDKLGLKGKKIGGCQISELHSAFFINCGQARADHVVMLISDVKMRVRNQLGIQLQEEIRYLGF